MIIILSDFSEYKYFHFTLLLIK